MAAPLASGETDQPDPQIWLLRYIRLQKKYDVQIDEMLREASDDAVAQVDAILAHTGSSTLRAAQLQSAAVAIQNTLGQLWRLLGDTIKAGQAEAKAVALATSFDWDTPLLRLAFPRRELKVMRSTLMETSKVDVEAAIARVYHSRVPLATSVYKTRALADGWVERRVNSGLARGLTVAELKKEVQGFIKPEVKGGASYAAKRLARTEINNAYHAVTIVHNEDKPWNTGMIWRLSGSHPREDICDLYASKSPWAMGTVPGKAHPQCLCTTFPEVQSEDDFWDSFKSGEYDEYIDKTYDEPTPKSMA